MTMIASGTHGFSPAQARLPELSMSAAAEARRQFCLHRWRELRFGALPPHLYRILDCTDAAPPQYQLELDGERIPLTNRAGNPAALHGDTARAVYVARDWIIARRGDEAGVQARFRFVWAGDGEGMGITGG